MNLLIMIYVCIIFFSNFISRVLDIKIFNIGNVCVKDWIVNVYFFNLRKEST